MKQLLIYAFFLIVLLGCGGGDPEDNNSQPTTSIQPVNCLAVPEQCQ